MPTKVKGTTGVDKIEAGAVITNPEFSGNATVTGTLTVDSTASINGSNLPQQFGFRNLIINGDMQVAQRGTSATGITGTTYNTIDRYKTDMNVAGTWTQTQSTDVPTGQGFSTSLKMDCTTANANLASNAWLRISQTFEGQMLQHLKKGTSSAESVTLSFWVKSNKTGTYIMELRDGDNTRDISKSYTIDTADTWEKKTITYAGDTSGAFDNDNGGSLVLEMWLASGTDRSSGTLQTSWGTVVNANRAAGQVNLADSTSNYINITGCQLEIGEGASDFEFLPYDVQLARCQRYYWQGKELGLGYAFAYAANSGNYIFTDLMRFPVTMRTTPTMAQVLAPSLTNCAINTVVASVDGAANHLNPTAVGNVRCFNGTYSASAEL